MIENARQALAFVRRHGIILESARGFVPSFAEAVTGGAICGNWWAHPKGREIFRLTRAVRASPEVLVCRLVDGKITYVHRRFWPALVRLAERFPRRHLAQVCEVHTTSGRHVLQEQAFPKWVPAEVFKEAKRLTDDRAEKLLGNIFPA